MREVSIKYEKRTAPCVSFRHPPVKSRASNPSPLRSIYLFGSSKSLLDDVPIHDVPNSVDVIRSDVAVINIICVFPNVNTEKRDKTSSGLERILIGAGGNLKTAGLGVETKPTPSTSLHGDGGRRHLLLHLLHSTERFGDGSLQGTAGLDRAGSLGGKVLPEQGVVQMTAAVEFECPFQADDAGNVPSRNSSIELLQGGVEIGHVRVVVLGVVQSHGLSADDGLEGIVVVGEVGKGVGSARRGRRKVRSGRLGHLLRHGGGAQVCGGTESGVDELAGGRHGCDDSVGYGAITKNTRCAGNIVWTVSFVFQSEGEIATPNAERRVTKHLITPALPIGVLTYNNLGVPRKAGRRGCDMVGVALNRVMIHMCTGMQVRGVLW